MIGRKFLTNSLCGLSLLFSGGLSADNHKNAREEAPSLLVIAVPLAEDAREINEEAVLRVYDMALPAENDINWDEISQEVIDQEPTVEFKLSDIAADENEVEEDVAFLFNDESVAETAGGAKSSLYESTSKLRPPRTSWRVYTPYGSFGRGAIYGYGYYQPYGYSHARGYYPRYGYWNGNNAYYYRAAPIYPRYYNGYTHYYYYRW